MMHHDLRCVIVASTGGSVMNALLRDPFFRSQIVAVVSDRACGAIDRAREHAVRADVLAEPDGRAFSDRLLHYLDGLRADYVISFFTKLFTGDLVARYHSRIVNLHPSLLPAFKGLDGFGLALKHRVRIVGTTLHFIDERMDAGQIIMQTAWPLDPTVDPSVTRHRLFVHQCKSLLQATRWLYERRVTVTDQGVSIAGVSYDDPEFSPRLDFDQAIQFEIPYVTGSM